MDYDAAMLDWAIAEVLSTSFGPSYASRISDDLRRRCVEDPNSLSESDRASLVKAAETVRGPYLLKPYGISRSWQFRLEDVGSAQLSGFSIIPQFRPSYGTIRLGQFAERIRVNPLQGEIAMRDIALAMLDRVRTGGTLNGHPIALELANGLMLIEGYKRSFVAIWDQVDVVRLIIGRPPTK
jgi:hypothetical protein